MIQENNIFSSRFKQAIRFTLECLIAIYIALEISIEPNPYVGHLIIALVLYICLKHNIVEKIIEQYNKMSSLIQMRDSSQKWNPRKDTEKSEEDLKDEIDKYLKNDQGKI